MRRNQRLIVAALIAALIAGIFWSQSRIPALNEKAQMGLRTSFGELAFEIVLPLTAQQSALDGQVDRGQQVPRRDHGRG